MIDLTQLTDAERDELAKEIGLAIEAHLGVDYLDDLTAYGVTSWVLQYLATGRIESVVPY